MKLTPFTIASILATFTTLVTSAQFYDPRDQYYHQAIRGSGSQVSGLVQKLQSSPSLPHRASDEFPRGRGAAVSRLRQQFETPLQETIPQRKAIQTGGPSIQERSGRYGSQARSYVSQPPNIVYEQAPMEAYQQPGYSYQQMYLNPPLPVSTYETSSYGAVDLQHAPLTSTYTEEVYPSLTSTYEEEETYDLPYSPRPRPRVREY